RRTLAASSLTFFRVAGSSDAMPIFSCHRPFLDNRPNIMAMPSVVRMCEASRSRYGTVFMNMGFTPGMGCTTLLQDMVGPYVANEMMFTGKRFKGSDLVQMGTNINYILPKEKVMPKAIDIAKQIAEKNKDSLYLLKYSLSARKKKLLIDARVQEDLMHRISFGFPSTKTTIKNFYVD
ncbi:MAG: hypothetical protein HN368_22615, partial [Spirochaetales bacterium]|nr:hypothetical protein [Spirochaetales bacterium]